MKWRLISVLTACLGLLGCAEDPRKDSMSDTLRLYERSIKWGEYSDAQLLTTQPATQAQLEEYENIKVISYEVVQHEMSDDLNEIRQVVEIKFFHNTQGIIKTLRDHQVWNYDDERKVWELQSGLPDFMAVFR